MHPELKAYLDDYYARIMARYDAMDRLFAQHDTLLSKLLAGVSTPQPVRPMGTAADGGLTDDTLVPAVVPDAFSFTTQAQEIPTVTHDAASVCIAMVPITCSMDCSTQVDAITSVDEVQDAVTTVSHKEVVQLISVQATPSIGISTSSSTEVVSSAATTTDVDPKASVQDLGALSVNTFPPAASELDHSVAFFVSSNLTAPAPTKCSAEPPRP